jgi:hypothetical protein
MRSKKGLTQDQLVLMIIALVVLGILLYLAYKYVLVGGESAGKLGDCTARPGQFCVATAAECTAGQAFQVGCPKEKPWCCIPEKRA